jgi:uncharacterized DUF497 family protein
LEFEWDDAKRTANIAKHGLDFLRVGRLMAEQHVVVPGREVGGEARMLAIGLIEERFVTAVFVMRGGNVRVISLRSARHGERRKYQAVYGN